MIIEDLRVYINRLHGIKCKNIMCPYNDNVYFCSTVNQFNDPYQGLCLNCLDDRNKDKDNDNV